LAGNGEDMLELNILPVGAYQSNCYILVDPSTTNAVLIDAGGDSEIILERLKDLQVRQILITHGHGDHVSALEVVRSKLRVPVGIHPADSAKFDINADIELNSGDEIHIGKEKIIVVSIPGHTPGSICFQLIDEGKIDRVIVGDAIFPGGPGATSTPEDLKISLESLERTVFTWDDKTRLYPGHGESTTVGAERKDFEEFCAKPLPPDLYGDVSWR
jgi:glyoxylase-like metal-dependent hydrolase (beta-lactamase superfamily II)